VEFSRDLKVEEVTLAVDQANGALRRMDDLLVNAFIGNGMADDSGEVDDRPLYRQFRRTALNALVDAARNQLHRMDEEDRTDQVARTVDSCRREDAKVAEGLLTSRYSGQYLLAVVYDEPYVSDGWDWEGFRSLEGAQSAMKRLAGRNAEMWRPADMAPGVAYHWERVA
jgi:hypothetical protein